MDFALAGDPAVVARAGAGRSLALVGSWLWSIVIQTLGYASQSCKELHDANYRNCLTGHAGSIDAASGSPLLFVHGFPLDHTLWSAQLPVFAQTHRVLSPRPAWFRRQRAHPGR